MRHIETESTEDAATGQQLKDGISTYLYFSSLYFVTVGILYLWGYWPRFHINILEYIGLTDIVRLTAYPIASAFSAAAIGVVIGEINWKFRLQPKLEGLSDEAKDRTGRFAWPIIQYGYVAIVIALSAWDNEEKWNYLPVLLAVPLYFAAKGFGLLERLIPHESPRSAVIYLLVVLPLWSYGYGRLEADKVLQGIEYEYIERNTVEGLAAADFGTKDRPIRYLGHASDYFFLLLPDNHTVVVSRFDSAKAIFLAHYSAEKPKPYFKRILDWLTPP